MKHSHLFLIYYISTKRFSLFYHSKGPNKLNGARGDPNKKGELTRHCSSNTDNALLLHKELITCMYDVIEKIKLYYFFFVKFRILHLFPFCALYIVH